MTRTASRRPSSITGVRIVTLIIVWVAIVYVFAPQLGLYYEALAAWYMVPPLGLIYAYCASHRSAVTAVVAVVATLVAVLVIGVAMVIPKASVA